MWKPKFALMTALAVLASTAVARADCGSCGSKAASAKKCSSVACAGEKCTTGTCSAAQCSASKGCPIATAMERLPELTYAVGKKATCCPKEAAKLAKGSGGHIHFCVAGKEFDSKSDAQSALIDATEKFVAAFTKPHTCPKSGQLTLAGHSQKCEKNAARTAELMKKAMAKVKFTYLVGDKQCGCPVAAGKLVKESGKEKVFVVGEEKTACEKTARLNLARAKYRAAVEAMLQAESKASPVAPSKES